jgi:hypothetical protein
MENITIIQEQSNLPWYKKINPEQKAFMQHYKGKDKHTAIQDAFLPAMYKLHEVIHSDDTSPATRVQACQIVINKVIGDKIDIQQAKIALDVNKLLDQLTIIKGIVSQPIDITDDNE